MPSLPMFMFAAVLLGSPSPSQVPDPMEPFLSIFGITLETTTLEQARAKLGGPKAVHNGGDAAASACAQCYTGSDGTTLALVSHREMGGCESINWYELVRDETMATYSGDDRFVAPKDKRPKCSPLKGLSRSKIVGGRLKLGMTEAQVTRVLGKPSERAASRATYSSEVPMKMTKEDETRLKDHGDFTTLRVVEVEFADGRATAITVSQVTSN